MQQKMIAEDNKAGMNTLKKSSPTSNVFHQPAGGFGALLKSPSGGLLCSEHYLLWGKAGRFPCVYWPLNSKSMQLYNIFTHNTWCLKFAFPKEFKNLKTSQNLLNTFTKNHKKTGLMNITPCTVEPKWRSSNHLWLCLFLSQNFGQVFAHDFKSYLDHYYEGWSKDIYNEVH